MPKNVLYSIITPDIGVSFKTIDECRKFVLEGGMGYGYITLHNLDDNKCYMFALIRNGKIVR